MTTAAPTSPIVGIPTSTTHISLSLKRFGGKETENPEVFLRHFRHAKGASGWTDTQALHYVGLHMDGKAAEWFNNQDFTRWEVFERALTERFGLDPSKILYALSKRKQKKDESVRDYSDAMRTLARCSSIRTSDQVLFHFFMEGLREDVKTFVKYRKPSSFEAAVAEGEYYEDQFMDNTVKLGALEEAIKVETPPGTPTPAPIFPNRFGKAAPTQAMTATASKDPMEELTKQMSRLALAMEQQGRQGMVFRNGPAPPPVECWNCGRRGHRAIECPYPARQSMEKVARVNCLLEEDAQEQQYAPAPQQPCYYYQDYADYPEPVIYADKRAWEGPPPARAPAARRF
jgi:hypothetical protein